MRRAFPKILETLSHQRRIFLSICFGSEFAQIQNIITKLLHANRLGEQTAIRRTVLKGPRNSESLKAAHADSRISQWELGDYSRILGQSRLSEKQLEVKHRMETSLGGTPPAVLW